MKNSINTKFHVDNQINSFTAMFKLIFVAIVLAVLVCAEDNAEQYQGYKLFSIVPTDKRHEVFLRNIELVGMEGVDFWNSVQRGGLPTPVHIMVAPETIEEFQILLKSQNFDYKIIIDDLTDVIAKERQTNFLHKITSRLQRSNNNHPDFSYYWRHAEVNAYLDSLGKKYSDTVQVVSIGKSYENRDMRAIEISRNGRITGNRPIIFVDATIHAREWIAPMVALELIYQLVENNQEHADILDSVDWMIVPMINVDGYEFTHTNLRFWRKTRSQNKDSDCKGTDPNRNFDFKWAVSGTSSNVSF